MEYVIWKTISAINLCARSARSYAWFSPLPTMEWVRVLFSIKYVLSNLTKCRNSDNAILYGIKSRVNWNDKIAPILPALVNALAVCAGISELTLIGTRRREKRSNFVKIRLFPAHNIRIFVRLRLWTVENCDRLKFDMLAIIVNVQR